MIAEIRIMSIGQVVVLYQCWFPDFDNCAVVYKKIFLFLKNWVRGHYVYNLFSDGSGENVHIYRDRVDRNLIKCFIICEVGGKIQGNSL